VYHECIVYKRIHASPKDCILYSKDLEELKKCLRCGLSCYKVKDRDFNCDENTNRPDVRVL
jgi:hypothetical protein